MEVKQNNFRVKLAFEFYRVGQVIQPTGLWRDSLLARGFIEPVPTVVKENPSESPLLQRVTKRSRNVNSGQV